MQVRKNKTYEVGFKRQVVADIEAGIISAAGQLCDQPTKREKQLEAELEKYKLLLAEAHAKREFIRFSRRNSEDSSGCAGLRTWSNLS